jgi:hypothetical protein
MDPNPPMRIRCPHCGRVAASVDRFFVRETAGPVERLGLRCEAGHRLAPLPAPGESRWIPPTPGRTPPGARGA